MKKTLVCLFVLLTLCISSLYAQDTAPEEYIVEKMDTLWDISDRRLEDPFLWPKLWNVNPHIENPDLIYPGSRIMIPSREELMRMPSFPGKKAPLARKQKLKKQKDKSSELTKTQFIFAPERKQKYVVDKMSYIASGWIADDFHSVGEVFHSAEGRHIVGTKDTVYLKFDDDEISEKRFYSIRDIKIVKHPITGEIIGHQIRVTGILEVVGMDNKMHEARVVNSFGDIQLGDGLLPYHELEPPLASAEYRTPDINGYIIESHTNSYLLGEGDIIFLDKGENDGLKLGDVFSVFGEMPTERPLGNIQIVSLQPTTSGAVLLQAVQELNLGLKWGPKSE